MRVPIPPAITTAASGFPMSERVDWISGWGARIRTWDHGTKTRCLTAWLRPRARAILPALEQEKAERDEGEDHDEHDERAEHDVPGGHDDGRAELRRSEQPGELSQER